MNVAVIIPAAGKSERFGARDKLNEDLGGRPMLLRTAELFTKRDEVKTIIVAGPPETLAEFKFRFGDQLAFHGAKVVAGGQVDRWESVKNALESVPEDCTHILVHDAARPATSDDVLKRIFEAAEKFDAVIPVIPISSTVKRLSNETMNAAEADPIAAAILGDTGQPTNTARAILETVDRAGLHEAQTPQIFKADLLRRAYAQDDLTGITDDAAAVERLGETVHAIEGDVLNLKITTPGDLKLVRSILGVRPPKDRPTHKRF